MVVVEFPSLNLPQTLSEGDLSFGISEVRRTLAVLKLNYFANVARRVVKLRRIHSFAQADTEATDGCRLNVIISSLLPPLIRMT